MRNLLTQWGRLFAVAVILTLVGCESDDMGFAEDDDAEPPTAPADLTATTISSSRIDLSWNEATDNIAVDGYHVYRDGNEVADVEGTTYTDSGLNASTSYTYEVAAYDAAGNVSARSSTATAETDSEGSDGSQELVISGLSAESGSSYEVVESGLEVGATRYTDRGYTFVDPIPDQLESLIYIRTANDDKMFDTGGSAFLSFDVDRDVTVYVAYDDRGDVPTWLSSGFADTGLDLRDSDENSGTSSVFSGEYSAGTVSLGPNDANTSMYSVILDAEGSDPPSDSDAPTPPTDLSATAESSSRIDLSWTASSDNVGVTGYRVYRDGSQIAEVDGTSHTDSGLSPSTTYSYEVAAYDEAGNVSDRSSAVSATTPESETQGNAPYPASAAIGGVSIDWSSHERRAQGSDNFPVTWGADGHQYTSWGDGGGFGGSNSNGRVSLGVARVEGTASSYTGINLNGGVNPESGSSSLSGKSYGILSLGGDLYMWRSPGSGSTNWDHVDLYKSTDDGHTWTTVISLAVTESEGVGIPTILQFGQDYAGSRDQYVYSYFIDIQDGSSLSVQAPGRVSLVRAPASQLDEPAGYEWFAGLDGSGQATWTSSVQSRAPVFEDPRGVGWNLSVIYNPGLDRYLLATEHSETMVGNLGIFDAQEPWGPWTTVLYEDNWPSGGQVQHSSFFWNFSAKWWSNEGSDFVLVFTGINQNDSWNSVQGSFTMP